MIDWRRVVIICIASVSLAVVAGVAMVVRTQLHERPRAAVPSGHIIRLGGATLTVTEALTPDEQIRGLSGTSSLAPDAGMLFDFGADQTPSMWMKDMNYSLDFVWINNRRMVTGITANVSPATYPATFSPPVPSRYVIEVNAGWAAAHHIMSGDQLSGQ